MNCKSVSIHFITAFLNKYFKAAKLSFVILPFFLPVQWSMFNIKDSVLYLFLLTNRGCCKCVKYPAMLAGGPKRLCQVQLRESSISHTMMVSASWVQIRKERKAGVAHTLAMKIMKNFHDVVISVKLKRKYNFQQKN